MAEYTETEEKRNSRRINENNIVLLVTWRCNFSCDNCIANCSKKQAPSNELMPIEKIEHFVSDCKKNDKKWNQITICGGEPTLHPQFKEICVLLKQAELTKALWLSTNGYTQKTKELMYFAQSIGILVDNSYKTHEQLVGSAKWRWVPINVAPVDVGYTDSALGKGCYQSEVCGLGYDSNGYWGCPQGAIYSRTFDFKPVCTSIKDLTDEKIIASWKEQCSICGAAFRMPIVTSDSIYHCDPKAPIDIVTEIPTNRVLNQAMSKTWIEAFRDKEK